VLHPHPPSPFCFELNYARTMLQLSVQKHVQVTSHIKIKVFPFVGPTFSSGHFSPQRLILCTWLYKLQSAYEIVKEWSISTDGIFAATLWCFWTGRIQVYVTSIPLYQWLRVLFSFNKIKLRNEIICGNGEAALYGGGLQVWLKAEDILNEQLWRFERRGNPARGIRRGSQITQRIETYLQSGNITDYCWRGVQIFRKI
jgi:hypothetical protein